MDREPRRLIGRSNVRDLVIITACILAWFYPINDTRILISLLLLAAGSVLHLLTKGVLIRNRVLCRDGIYRLSRHPYYTANYLIDVSFCLLSGNTYLLAAYPFLFFWAYGPTFKKEEGYLSSLYGDEYTRYILETPQVLPDTYSLRHWKQFLTGFSFQRVSLNEVCRIMRFWAVACFIAFLHDLKKEGLTEFDPRYLYDNADGLTFLALVVILTVAQVIVGRKKKQLD